MSRERAQESAFNTEGPGGGQEMVENTEESERGSRIARRGWFPGSHFKMSVVSDVERHSEVM